MRVVSRFEYAIMQIADPEEAEKCRPITQEEEDKIREEKIRDFVSKIKTTPIRREEGK